MRRRKATVELFEQLRREYEDGVGTIAGVARQFGVHRRLVREALRSAVPKQREAKARARPRTGPVAAAAYRSRSRGGNSTRLEPLGV